MSSGAEERSPEAASMTPRDLASIRERLRDRIEARRVSDREAIPACRDVLVCTGGGCVSSRSPAVVEALRAEISAAGLDERVRVIPVGCMGLCEAGPLVLVSPDGVLYREVDPDGARRIVAEHLATDRPVEDLEVTWRDGDDGPVSRSLEVPFFAKQVKIALRNCGVIDPLDIDEYIARDGYLALEKVLFEATPETTLDTVKRSGLRGRGGAGFLAGLKWQFVQEAPGDDKFVVCNADEGDPGAFMDRSILEGDPHSVIEAMIIAGRVVGSRQGYVYVRAEYPLAIERLGRALHQARRYGLLGDAILGSDFSFDLEIRIGAGAFVCGEETALMHSIEGKRGTPRPRPPFPAQKGLWGKPTLLNNVETWANVPIIIRRGAEWYAAIGNERSKGTKVFALAGNVRNTGLVEVPMGISLREVVETIGGGIRSGMPFKAAQSGGPSGGCIPAAMADVPIDYESLQELGAIMGSGGLIIMDEGSCMVELARFFLDFLADESCGKCPPCRIGTRVLLNILDGITRGEGKPEDLETLEKLSLHIQSTSLCGLGQTAPNAVLSTLRHFREEYVEHIELKHCRACECREIVASPCSHACPAGIDVPRYLREAAKGRFDNAYLVVRERVPLPHICGLVCFAPCENRCRRARLDEHLSIRAVKRAAVEYGSAAEPDVLGKVDPTGKKVAVVGSGPAGLTAAYYLARKGHQVVVFESLPEAGGMLRYGIPRYRLPGESLDHEIDRIIKKSGVEIRTSERAGSVEDLRKQGFDAVFLAIGAHRGFRMGIPGEDEPGIWDGVGFLRRIAEGKGADVGARVAVVGGGNTAIDAARSALRVGAREVTILYRRSRQEMPADPAEVEAALEEEVAIQFLTQPLGVHRQGEDLLVDCLKMKLGKADASGRRRPEPIAGSEFQLKVDTIIVAIGQKPEAAGDFGVGLTRGELAIVDRHTLATDSEGVFAGGDFVLGPASVIEAVAHGRRAAVAIDRYLGGSGDIGESLVGPEELADLQPPGEEDEPTPRLIPEHLVASSRRESFDQVENTYTQDEATTEAKRCLHCDLEFK